ISATIMIILLAVAVFLISTTVTMGISVRKDEIAIMRLVGATDFFIRSPFIVEGIAMGIIGTILPLGILYLIYNSVISYIQSRFQMLSGLLTFLDVNIVFRTLVPISLGIGVGIGFIGSFLTVRKHLRR
ncbi:MAG: FtsX-like permease family protein, partial [Acetivibrio sp.]